MGVGTPLETREGSGVFLTYSDMLTIYQLLVVHRDPFNFI